MITRALAKTEAMVVSGGMVYKSVAQLVPLYSSESWVVTGVMLKVLGGISPPGRQADHGDDGNLWGGRGVGISPYGGGTGSRGTKSHNVVH